MTTPPRPVRTDRGDTLTAIMGGVATSVQMSDIQRKQATAGAAVRDYAEAIENYVASGHYMTCVGSTATTYASAPFTAPTGFAASATAAKSWNVTTSQWVTCATDNGYQLVTLTVTSSDGRASEKLSVVLRKPCRPTDLPCAL
jgi:hypothetical protein